MKDNVSSPGVQITRDERTLSFTLDRPETGNEISGAMFEAMLEALQGPVGDAVLLRIRANGPVFCTGRERAGRDALSIRGEVARLIALKQAIRQSPLISIAEVQGDAAGFGMGLAVLCDFTLIADTAALCFPEMRKGLPPAAIMAYLGRYALPKRVFPLVLLGGAFTPAQALEAGLATAVCEPGELAAHADALAASVLAMDADGARQCKQFFQAAQESSLEDNFRLATELLTVETLRLQARH